MVHTFECCGQSFAFEPFTGSLYLISAKEGNVALPRAATEYREGLPLGVSDAATDCGDASEADELKAIERSAFVVNRLLTCKEASEVDELKAVEQEGDILASRLYSLKSRLDQPPPIKSLCLNVAHACNLRCAYCFAGNGQFGGDPAVMPVDVAKAAVDFLIEASGSTPLCEIDFFGGEPLLNWRAVEETVSYAKKRGAGTGKQFRFTITTNATLLDDAIIQFINNEMENVVISLDGRPEVHDSFRVDFRGRGTYHTVLQKACDLVSQRGNKDYFVRGTFTRHNLDFDKDVLHLADQGFKYISVEPVIAASGNDWKIQDTDTDIILSGYERLALEMLHRRRLGRPFTFFHFLVSSKGPCVEKRVRGCSVGAEYIAVSPDGLIYPCHQFVGKPEFVMGSVLDGKLDERIRDQFVKLHALSKPTCASCWAMLYCGGGCAANSLLSTGSMEAPDSVTCALIRKRLECGLFLLGSEAIS